MIKASPWLSGPANVVRVPDESLRRPRKVQGVFSKCWHIGITVGDMEGSVAFYREVLGFEIVGVGEASQEEDEILDLEGVHLLATSMRSGELQLELSQFLTPPGRTRTPKLNDVGCVHMALGSDEDI